MVLLTSVAFRRRLVYIHTQVYAEVLNKSLQAQYTLFQSLLWNETLCPSPHQGYYHDPTVASATGKE